MTRAESYWARRRERGAFSEDESTGLGEDSAGLARRKSTEARRREHGCTSSETVCAEALRAQMFNSEGTSDCYYVVRAG